MIEVNNSLIRNAASAELEISLLPFAVGLLLVTVGCIAYLEWRRRR